MENNPQDNVILTVQNLKKYFPVTTGLFHRRTHFVKAVDGVSFTVGRGETFGLVGETGCGKTTLGRAILQLYRPTGGEVIFEGQDITRLKEDGLRHVRRRMQMIFQDPYSSLDPRMSVGSIVEEPLLVHKVVASGKERKELVAELFQQVGLNPYMTTRFPHELSGGQRQRVGIARALALRPSLIVCDEPVSALDVSIQAQIVNLLQELQERFTIAYIFIAHDLSVVRHISERVAVMYLGHVMEVASRTSLYANPLHPYTRALLSAVPIPDPVVERQRKRIILTGEMPSPLRPPPGCVFHPRCSLATEDCQRSAPSLRKVGDDQWVACLRI